VPATAILAARYWKTGLRSSGLNHRLTVTRTRSGRPVF
jgi:hypothetical protein